MLKPYEKNPAYWQYKGKPILLVGGSDEDNPFQWTNKKLTEHLDLLVESGGNYIRNTMSDRDEGNVYAFKKTDENKYDLNRWNDEYWNRLQYFLEETEKRDIIVHLTLWDQHDHVNNRWDNHPWNPDNNINYSLEKENNSDVFYSSIKDKREKIIKYQKQYINKILSLSINYDNILYNINNESWAGHEWENFWAKYIYKNAEQKGKEVQITTMHMRAESSVRTMMDKPDLFSFTDISQNNQDAFGNSGQKHMDFLLKWRKIIHSYFDSPRPINNVKIYGGEKGKNYKAGTAVQAVERFWRNIFGGSASSRFHRPESAWGIGLSPRAQKNLKALKLFQEYFDIFQSSPHNELIVSENEGHYSVPREDNEAYCMADLGDKYAVYFPAEGTVKIDPLVYVDKVKLRWLDINKCSWTETEYIEVEWSKQHNVKRKGRIRLVNPENTSRIALLEI
ncbi:MAG: DUF6298 domain-containing protein [Halanaerobiaceae bacterium]